MSYFKAKMHQIRFRLGLRPRPRWGAYSAPPDSLAKFKGPRGAKREGEGGGRWKRMGIAHPYFRLKSCTVLTGSCSYTYNGCAWWKKERGKSYSRNGRHGPTCLDSRLCCHRPNDLEYTSHRQHTATGRPQCRTHLHHHHHQHRHLCHHLHRRLSHSQRSLTPNLWRYKRDNSGTDD